MKTKMGTVKSVWHNEWGKDGNWMSTNLDNLEYLDFLDWAKNLDNSRLSRVPGF